MKQFYLILLFGFFLIQGNLLNAQSNTDQINTESREAKINKRLELLKQTDQPQRKVSKRVNNNIKQVSLSKLEKPETKEEITAKKRKTIVKALEHLRSLPKEDKITKKIETLEELLSDIDNKNK